MPRTGPTVTALVLVAVAGTAGILGARWVVDTVGQPGCEFSAAGRTESFTPEQSANAATITMVGVQRDLPPRAASIAIATAIQESKLRNLTYGDADSQGLFQQRPSQGWGSVQEITDPVHATGAFYDRLVQVPGWQDGVVTEVAQEVQRSAYPQAYADHEGEGRVLASVLTGQSPAGLTCELDEPGGSGDAQGLADKALAQFGYAGDVDGTGGVATFAAPGPSQAWAVASWAVAHAESEDVVRVEVDAQAWDRSTDPGTWQPTDPDAGTDATTVRVTLAS